MSRINGGARLSYVKLVVIVHRTTVKAVLLGREEDDSSWVPRTALSHRAEEEVDSLNVLPETATLEIVKWKADELGWS